MKRNVLLVVFAMAVLLTPVMASAALLTGTFNTVGRADVRVGPNWIDWGKLGQVFEAPPASVATLDRGDILFINGTGAFSALLGVGNSPTNGTIKDLIAPPDLVGVPINEPNFLTSAQQPTWNFTLNFIFPSAAPVGCTTIPGASCTAFAGSPFTLVNGPDAGGGRAISASVSMAVRGTVSDGTPGAVSIFNGTFSNPFEGTLGNPMAAADIVALLARQGYVQSPESGNFAATAVPEPATMLLLGTGLIGLGATARRRMRK